MNIYKISKIVRVIWSLLVLLIFLSIFLLAENISEMVADWQVIPSIISTLTFFAIGIITFFVIETLIFGRIYCSFTCPLGVLQDISIRLGKIFRIPKPKKLFTRNQKLLRYSLLAIFLGALFLGAAIPLGLFGPFAIFGRFTAAVIKPSFIWLNNFLMDNSVFENLSPLHYTPFSLLLLVVAATAFISIMIAAIFRGRIFCNTLCPVGAILGLLSKVSWFKFTLNTNKCTKCGKCAKMCKANCIDLKNGIVDNERCVTCFNCTAICPDNAMHYIHSKESKSVPTDFSKRDFFIIGGSAVAGAAILPKLLKGTPSPNAVMPPGAIDFERFTSKCTACQLCISNCPGNVIKPAALQYGLSGFLQPRLDFDSGMCEFDCIKCSNICPNGALEPLTVKRKKRLQIGLAKYFRKICVVVTDRTHCGACAEHCPTGAVHMVDWEDGLTIPKVEPELCIGCGACEFICPVRPKKAIVVFGNAKQTQAKVAKIKQSIDHLKGQDFPF
jgi:ferredoxin